MQKKWKRKILINNPVELDQTQTEQDLCGGNQVIVQFSHPDFYGSILEEVDELCARFADGLVKLNRTISDGEMEVQGTGRDFFGRTYAESQTSRLYPTGIAIGCYGRQI
ncbi:hypothetical protein [Paenibacillus sp. 1-18]|uniref:hypothetical protein n=1 Tax=Paenibacillus sp. 1-18 TaxID=1333846 RepID=UPI00046E7C0B|nr:hypothetical protein [Paenibacillus sp. 1-18]